MQEVDSLYYLVLHFACIFHHEVFSKFWFSHFVLVFLQINDSHCNWIIDELWPHHKHVRSCTTYVRQ